MRLLSALLVVLLCGLGTPLAAAATIHVGYQRYGTLILLKARGTLEPRLKALGWNVDWVLFPAGPPLMEAMNAGSIDFGTVGETPPVFAQAAGVPFVYVAATPDAPSGEAVLVPHDSRLRSVRDLKGRRIAYTRGSNANYLLLEVLRQAGLAWSDITAVNLAPADGPAAFQRGAVDAWSIWDPYQAAAIAMMRARVLRDGSGLVHNHQYLVAARDFASRNADIVRAVMEQVAQSDAWSAAHRAEVTQMLARSSGLAPSVVAGSVGRLAFGTKPLTGADVAQQQEVADGLAAAGLIPDKVSVRQVVWTGRP